MREIDVAELDERLQQGGTLVDVREPREYVEGHVPGARLAPMSQLSARLGEIDKQGPVYVICRSGNRSGAMLDLMLAKGFDAYNVAGGTVAWARSGRPLDQGI
jgi:rhodanese-related sulfurtransferase